MDHDTCPAAAERPEKKKTGTKLPLLRIMLSILAGICALTIFWCAYFLLVGVPTPEMAALAGAYSPVSAQGGEVTLDASEAMTVSVVLSPSGACKLNTAARSAGGRWRLQGENFSMRCGSVRLHGSLSASGLLLYDAFGSGMELLLSRTAEGAADAGYSGEFMLREIAIDGVSYSEAEIVDAGYGETQLLLSPDRTGRATLFDKKSVDISYDSEALVYRGMRLAYTLEGGTLRVEYTDKVQLFFKQVS